MADARDADIAAFRRELARLDAEGALCLSADDTERIAAHHAALPGRPVAALPETARLSFGLRIATLLGAVALSIAYALLIDSVWAALDLAAQLPLVIVPPIVLAFGVHAASRRDTTRYIPSVIASVAVIALAVNLVVITSRFDLPDSRNGFLVVGVFAMSLAYGYRLSLPLVFGIVGIGAWLWSLAALGQSIPWGGAFDHLEPLVAVGAISMLLAPRLPGPSGFAAEYRGLGAMAVAIALLVLGQTARASAMSFADPQLVTASYQVVGAVTFVAMIVIGVRRDQSELVRVGTAAALLFLMLRLFHWFWDAIPKWLFFLSVGMIAVAVIVMLRRVRLRRVQA